MSMKFESKDPRPMPIKEVVVNTLVCLPTMSPILFLFANFTLMEALEAPAVKKQMFLPALAIEARAKKYCGKAKAMISM